MNYFRRFVFDATDTRLVEIRDLFESGVSELTGKTRRLVGTRPEEQGGIIGRFGGVKKSVPALAHFEESPRRIAKAIRKGRRDPLYRPLREVVLEDVLKEEAEAIQSYIDLASPEELAAIAQKPQLARRELIKAHAGRRYCETCKRPHRPSIHLSHGRGAFKRTHGAPRPTWVREMLQRGPTQEGY